MCKSLTFLLSELKYSFLMNLMFVFIFNVCSDDEKLSPVPASVSTVPFTGPPAKPAPHTLFLDKLQELNTSRYQNSLSDKFFAWRMYSFSFSSSFFLFFFNIKFIDVSVLLTWSHFSCHFNVSHLLCSLLISIVSFKYAPVGSQAERKQHVKHCLLFFYFLAY